MTIEAIAQLAKDAPAYATCEAAAAAVLQMIVRDNSAEYGGAIIHKGEMYYYTIPVTSGQGEHVHYGIQLHKGETLCGLYHTHPKNAGMQLWETNHLGEFSDDDTAIARALKVTSYMVDSQSRQVHTFKPRQ